MVHENPNIDKNADANHDPVSGEPGSHPVGTGVGAAGAGVAATVIGGLVGGPVGAVVGAVVGSVAGGLAGKSVAENVNPTEEDTYWRQNYGNRDYVEPQRTYEDYQPAYQTGYEGFARHAGDTGRTYEEVEPDLQRDYESRRGGAGLPWEKAKGAARDAWVKLYEERLVVDKNRVKAGEVTVGKRVETETAQVAVPVEKERVVIERVTPADAGTTVDPANVNFGTTEPVRVEVYEEKADISKQAFVREEVNIRKEVQNETVQVEDQVRREELDLNTSGLPVDEKTNRPTNNPPL
jgi:uncharacterized protein (TIGR02271 family)